MSRAYRYSQVHTRQFAFRDLLWSAEHRRHAAACEVPVNDPCIHPVCQPRPAPRPAAEGTRICQPHTTQFFDHATAIPDLWEQFLDDDALLPGKGTGGRAAPGIALSAPLNLTVLSMRDVRTSWAEPGDLLNPQRALAEIVVRALLDSTGTHGPIGRYSVRWSCQILGGSKLTYWTLAQDWAGLMCWTVGLVYQQLAGLAGEHRPRSVGSCPECTGRMWPIPTGARCGTCSHTVGGFDLLGKTA